MWLGILSTLVLTFYLLCYLFLADVTCFLQLANMLQETSNVRAKNKKTGASKKKEGEGGCESASVARHLVMWAYCVAKCTQPYRAFLMIPDIGAIIYSDDAQHSLWASVMHSRPLGQIRMHAWWQMATSAPAATRTHTADVSPSFWIYPDLAEVILFSSMKVSEMPHSWRPLPLTLMTSTVENAALRSLTSRLHVEKKARGMCLRVSTL